jgi:transcriptional regulator with XRE-family HTH domain
MLIRLKIALFRQGLRQMDLARLVQADPARISRILRGHVRPRPRERARIARVLRLPSWQLFPNIGRGRLRGKHATSKQGKLNKGVNG